jgi:hypothetical protein
MIVTPLAALFCNRRFFLFALTALLAMVLAFFAVPDRLALTYVSQVGFWAVLLTFVLWLYALWESLSSEVRSLTWRKVDWLSVGVVLFGGTVLIVHESFGFKIMMDEAMLLGTSMSMHLDKTVLTPFRGNDIQGAFAILEGMVDKRPLFFPFLVSLLHDLTGYRPGNVFVLNGTLVFVFLGLVCTCGRRLVGRFGGWLGVLLFAGLPLLGHNATGGGFELLNLVMILATLLLGARYVERRDRPALTAFVFSALLLGQVRYESVVFLLPAALLILWVWWNERSSLLPWPVLIAPLLMVHYPLQHRIFDLRASAWELGSKPGYTEPFSIRYIPENLSHALNFFFGRASEQPNSPILSVLGCLAIPFFALLVLKRLRALHAETPSVVATTIFSLGFLLHFLLLMCYFWGKFDDVIIRRLSLPVHLGMVVALLSVLPQFSHPAVIRILTAAAAVSILAHGVPSMAAHAYSQEYLPGRETAWRREFMAAQPRPDYLVIDNDSILWVAHKVSATPTAHVAKRRDDIAFHMRNRTFSAVYVFQRFNIDPETGAMTVRPGDDPGPAFVLEPVMEERMQLLTLDRISRVKEIKSGETTISAPESRLYEVPKSRAEIDRLRQAYIENFVRQLP